MKGTNKYQSSNLTQETRSICLMYCTAISKKGFTVELQTTLHSLIKFDFKAFENKESQVCLLNCKNKKDWGPLNGVSMTTINTHMQGMVPVHQRTI